MKKLCIYHGNCADGFGAATVVRLVLGKDTVAFYPGIYQTDPPNVKDRDVILVDFSYKRSVLLEMAKDAKTILILDHHKSAQEDLVDLPENITAVFDMSESGAVITWRYFYLHEKIPKFLLHIQDRDLWQFKLKDTRELQAAVFSYPYDFDLWESFIFSTEGELNKLISEGKILERKHLKDIKELIEVATQGTVINGRLVPTINVPYMLGSDACAILCKNNLFAAYYWDSEGYRNFGLRSEEGGEDVSKIAVKFGGGGHEHASGFRVPFDELNTLSD